MSKISLKRASALIAFGKISRIVMPFYMSYVFHEAQDVFNSKTGLDVFNIYLLLAFTVATCLIVVLGAIAKKSGDDICEYFSSEYVIRNLPDVFNAEAMSSFGKQQITSNLIELKSRADSLYKLKAANISDKVTVGVFLIVIVLAEGVYSSVTVVFAILSYISSKIVLKHNLTWLNNFNSSLQENNDNIRLECVIKKKKPMISLGCKWDQILIRSVLKRNNNVATKEGLNNQYQSHLKSLSLVEKVCTICITSIAIMSSGINQSEYVLYLLLAGRLILPSASIATHGMRSDISHETANNGNTDTLKNIIRFKEIDKKVEIYSSNSIINASIEDNINLGVASNSLGKRFLQLSSAGAWIDSLPMGLNTRVDKNSKAIPKYIRQLIAIARIITIHQPSTVTIAYPQTWLHPTTYKELTTALKAIGISTRQLRNAEDGGKES